MKLTLIPLLFVLASISLNAQNAPISTTGIVVTTGNTAVVPITAVNFTNIASGNLVINYNQAITTVTGVTIGPLLGGSINVDLTVPGVVSLSWYVFPSKTLPNNSVIFNITCSKVTSGTSTLEWFDNGSSCHWYNGNYVLLNDTPTSTYYINGSVTFSSPLAADFMANNTTPPRNTTVQFTDLTTGGPTAWSWSFDRPYAVYVNGTSAASQNPQVQFTEGGLYTVTLVASVTGSSNTKVKVGYIRAGSPGVWSGSTSSTWGLDINWENWLLPGNTNDILIPGTCPNWPVYNGNLTVGVDFRSLTLSSPSSRLTVNGNLILH